jgi:hypothetical protein
MDRACTRTWPGELGFRRRLHFDGSHAQAAMERDERHEDGRAKLMAMESACKLQMGREHYEGKARMEGDHIDFAGQTKYRFRLNEIRSARREDDAILFSFHTNPVCIRLSSARAAEEWLDYIQHPQTLADRLGVREGTVVRILNLEDADLVSSLETKKTRFVGHSGDPCELVMLGVERASELRQIEDLLEALPPEGAVWVVLPKTGRMVTKANVVAAVKEAGLHHAEAIDYSETQTAFKIVRQKYARERNGFASSGAVALSPSPGDAAGRRAPARVK